MEARLKGIRRTLQRVDFIALFQLEKQLQHDYIQILFQEELIWYQKSREQWVMLGDKNTTFFHTQTIIRRKMDKIHGITLPNGIWCNDDSILQEEVQNFFKALFISSNHDACSPFLVSNSPILDEVRANELTKQVSKEEVSKL